MLANGVELVDARAALQESAGDRLLVGERDLAARQRKQRRPSPGNKAEHEIVARQAAHHRQDFARGCNAGRVRVGMPGLDHPYPLRRRAVADAGDDQPLERPAPVRLDRRRHRRRRLARADDDRSAARRRRQMLRDDRRSDRPPRRRRRTANATGRGDRYQPQGRSFRIWSGGARRPLTRPLRPPRARARRSIPPPRRAPPSDGRGRRDGPARGGRSDRRRRAGAPGSASPSSERRRAGS